MTKHTATMTRDEVAEAIKTETRLAAGNWCALPWEWYDAEEPNDPSACRVCAVGAVLWGAGVPPKAIQDVGDRLTSGGGSMTRPIHDSTDLKGAMEHSPFAALSRVFESAHARTWAELFKADNKADQDLVNTQAARVARDVSVAFVRKHFPAEITFEYEAQT